VILTPQNDVVGNTIHNRLAIIKYSSRRKELDRVCNFSLQGAYLQ